MNMRKITFSRPKNRVYKMASQKVHNYFEENHGRILTVFFLRFLDLIHYMKCIIIPWILTVFFCTPKNKSDDFCENSENTCFSKLFANSVMYEIDKNASWKFSQWIKSIEDLHRWNAKTTVNIMVLELWGIVESRLIICKKMSFFKIMRRDFI